ncbi:MAG: hypothetical protein H6739_42415 [Alphaproteobacteria bacterium]|nr:hypothetical protein [Alphaproteobacteria bacterium]
MASSVYPEGAGPDLRSLFVMGGALGDVVLQVPALQAVGRAYGPPRVLAPRAWAQWLDALGLGCGGWRVDDMRLLGLRAGPVDAARALLGPIDRAWMMTEDPELAAGLARLGATVERCGAPPAPGAHQGLTLLQRVCARLGVDAPGHPADIAPPLRPTPAWEASADALWPGPLDALLVPGSGGAAKCWPRCRFAALGLRLSQAGQRVAVMLGPDELERGWSAEDFGGLPVLAAPSVPETAALCARAGVVVGNDAGTSHLAAAAGGRVVALFGPTDPARWRPMGPWVRVLQDPEGLDALPVERALEAAYSTQSVVQPSG